MEKSKEEQLNIVLKNYDVVREQRNILEKQNKELAKENEELKGKLAQQQVLYKNMLDRYSDKHTEDWERKYNDLSARHKEKMDKYSQVVNENLRIKNILDSVRGVVCGAHNKLDELCLAVGVELNVPTTPKQEELVLTREDSFSIKEYQNKQFIKYIRSLADKYHKEGNLNGIGVLARQLKVSAVTKIQFFQYNLQDTPLTDERILKVYKAIKSNR